MKTKKYYFKWGLTVFLTVCAILVFYDVFYKGGTLLGFFNKLTSTLRLTKQPACFSVIIILR